MRQKENSAVRGNRKGSRNRKEEIFKPEESNIIDLILKREIELSAN